LPLVDTLVDAEIEGVAGEVVEAVQSPYPG
jgi:hypothetical protein